MCTCLDFIALSGNIHSYSYLLKYLVVTCENVKECEGFTSTLSSMDEVFAKLRKIQNLYDVI